MLLTLLPQFRSSTVFPSSSVPNPILPGDGLLPRVSKLEFLPISVSDPILHGDEIPPPQATIEELSIEEPAVRVSDSSQTTHYTSMPRLEIPIFEGSKPTWRIRRCERFFQFYNVAED